MTSNIVLDIVVVDVVDGVVVVVDSRDLHLKCCQNCVSMLLLLIPRNLLLDGQNGSLGLSTHTDIKDIDNDLYLC